MAAKVPFSSPLPMTHTEISMSINKNSKEVQEDVVFQIDKKKRISSGSAQVSKASAVQFEFVAVKESTGIHPYHHQQWPAAPVPPPPNPNVAPPPPNPAAVAMPPHPFDDVRTIFISGLPLDVKERELQNLLRWLPGYEASQINYKGEHPMGFALFTSPDFAHAAKDALQNMVFDNESHSVLHTEMAKKNLFIKRGIVADSNVYDQSKRLRTGGDYTHTGYASPTPFHPPPAPLWGPHGYMAPHPPPYDLYGGYAVPPVPMPAPSQVPMPMPMPPPSSYVPVQALNLLFPYSPYKLYVNEEGMNTKDNPPCNTLFIGNLGENINEDELRGLFSIQPGYKQMKIIRQERHTVCFIEFEDVNSAAQVHHNLQGAVIPSFFFLDGYTFSKNPYGKRKDSNHPGAAVAAAVVGPLNAMNGSAPPVNYQ
ncbi:hypothetical protein KSS87_017858 [Heliosperma pusillum]|nr:hypothetical protein KSS87_017858 [Heliosperma pusillum]